MGDCFMILAQSISLGDQPPLMLAVLAERLLHGAAAYLADVGVNAVVT